MTTLSLELERKARRLPAVERERLAGLLLAPLAEAGLTAVDKAWIVEAERRYEAWKSGRCKAIPAAQVMRSLRRKLKH